MQIQEPLPADEGITRQDNVLPISIRMLDRLETRLSNSQGQ